MMEMAWRRGVGVGGIVYVMFQTELVSFGSGDPGPLEA